MSTESELEPEVVNPEEPVEPNEELTELELVAFEEYLTEIEKEDMLEEDNGEVQVLEDQLEEQLIALESLYALGAVSQAQMASFEHLLPEGYTLKSYTKTPTRTNYIATVVSLEERNWGVIAAIGVAIVGLIARIVMWLFDRKSGKNDEAMEESAIKIAKAIKALETADPTTARAEAHVVDTAASEKWFELDYQAAISPGALLQTLFTQGPVVYDQFLTELKELSKLFIDSKKSSVSEHTVEMLVKHIANINKIAMEAMAKKYPEAIAVRDKPGVESWKETQLAIKNELERLSTARVSEKFSIEKYVNFKIENKVGINRFVVKANLKKYWKEDMLINSKKLLEAISKDIETANKIKERVNHEIGSGDQEKAELIVTADRVYKEAYTLIRIAITGLGVYSENRVKVRKRSSSAFKYLKAYHTALKAKIKKPEAKP
jgi:hypothetical protein